MRWRWGQGKLSPILSIFLACAGCYSRWAMKTMPAPDHFFFFFSSFSSPLCSSVLTDKKELRLGLKTTHSIGQQRWEESHTQWDIACMPRKERMLQLEGNAVFAVPCKHCHEATHRFVPGGTSVRFTCPFSIYAINRSNATCIPEILNAVRWNTALVFLDGHFQG